MALRDNAKRPDIDALVAMAQELVATSRELTTHARSAVERSRRVRAQVQSASAGLATRPDLPQTTPPSSPA